MLQRSALALLAGVLAVASPPARGENPRPYGLNVHSPTGAELTQIFDAASAAGIGWVRVDFVWAFIEPAPGHYDFSVYDEIVQAAQDRGLSVLGILAYTPKWATDGPELTGVPRNVADWVDFCGQVSARYRGRVTRFEIWNEPNLGAFFAGTRQDYIDSILRPGAEAIHGNSSALVGGPSLAHLVAGDADWYRWLDEVVRQASGSLDFVTHHLYAPTVSEITSKLTGSTRFANQPSLWDVENPSVREVLKRDGWYPNRPVWLTETGWASAEIGEAQQASNASAFLDAWFTGRSGQSWLEKAFLYEARDTAPTDTFGLLREDGTPKPAYDAVKSFIAAHGGVPPPPPPPPADGELSLFGGRFLVTAHWQASDGTTGFGHASSLTDESGEFWFFTPGNIELEVKALDGRPVNGHFWFFYGALSDVEYWVTAKDTATGATNEYHNPAGRICGQADTHAFQPGAAALEDFTASSPLLEAAPAVQGCVADARTLCLQGGRFQVRVAFHNRRSGSGDGHPSPATNESGRFWFFDPSNIELVVKVLDGRGTNGHFWVLWGALSDVAYDLTVSDLIRGTSRTYQNKQGNYCGGADNRAF